MRDPVQTLPVITDGAYSFQCISHSLIKGNKKTTFIFHTSLKNSAEVWPCSSNSNTLIE